MAGEQKSTWEDLLKKASWLCPGPWREESRTVQEEKTWVIPSFPPSFILALAVANPACASLSGTWTRRQQKLSVVGVVGFSQAKACSLLICASARCSLAQAAPWETLWLSFWSGRCSFHFMSTGLFQSHCQVCACLNWLLLRDTRWGLSLGTEVAVYFCPPGSI